ncbi:TraR/DksA C4-type zinc finger protein [Streptomyces sp. NE06-03E]|uniref:TraR/DksA family transcriptional regulator n=1 Tax=Streptomyces sp. NE06-03E TaxID=3028695 RepID=UPI0029B63659|nr:TraR/DksA C4-type zinc finger protein [Streptomyces sp. NE06-03E]MDX3055825.1 TraR/DksA C4-type zinc finger protein [Streptomyces sp. NE06-03E]
MVAKKTAVSRTASERSTAAAAGEETGKAGGEAGPEAEESGRDPAHHAPAKKSAAKKSTTKKSAAGKSAAKKSTTKKSAAGKSAAKKSTAKKSAAKKASKKATGAAQAAEQTGAHTVVAKKSAARTTAVGEGTATAVPPARAGAATAPGDLAVRPGEDPWTPEEVDAARTELAGEVLRLRTELEASGAALAGLMRDSGDGAGDDDADTGTKNITREHELSLAAHAQETLDQTERALARLDAGTYGLCEVCGKPIGKARMQAFPRATLCVEDKQKQERRG